MKTTTAAILVIGSAAVFLTGCAEFQHLIAGNEDGVANTIEGVGSTAGGIIGSILPPPFGTLAAAALTGLAAWGAERVRSFNKGAAGVVAMVDKARAADPAFDAAFSDDDSPAVVALKNTLRENTRLRKAFDKTRSGGADL